MIKEASSQRIGEFERTSVPEQHLKSWKSFLGMYAGEHAAGTEFMIGPLFLSTGVSAIDLIIGLLIGNLLAVLSWRYLTAEIAIKHRLTLYFHLEKIAGRRLVQFYNLANGILFCFLAGAMITVSATATGIPLNMKMPGLADVWPTGSTWITVVVATGVIISIVAAKGYNQVARIANWLAPVIILGFVAGGWIAATQLGISNFQDLIDVWGSGTSPLPGQIKFTFWHVVIWSWFCNAAMHIGMADLSVMRFARHPRAGWTTAAGMYIGHYMAWIAAALMYSAYLNGPEATGMIADGLIPPVAPGPLAYDILGIFGAITVVFAGWTTANPTIYRAGLAFQAIFPQTSSARATLVAGAIATFAGLFPAFAMKLLDFVALYGFILAPVGAIITFEHFFGARWGTSANLAEKTGVSFHKPAFLAWCLSTLFYLLLGWISGIFLSFLILPAWLTSGFLYLWLNRIFDVKK